MSSEEATVTTTTLLTDIACLHFGAPERLVFSGNKADSWNFFFKRWSNYALLTRLDRKPREIQVAILENCLGDDPMRIYQGIQFDTRLELKEELNRMTRLEVIESVKKTSPCVCQLVLTRKKNEALKICLDPHEHNKALMREHYTMPILEDVLHDTRGAKIFTKADLSSGYWHVELDEASSNLTTFQTGFGRYRWRQRPFGLNSAAKIFQMKLVKGIIIIADDLVVYGINPEEHERRLRNLLQKCQTIEVKQNPEKLEICLDAITFMGHRITKEGIVVDPEKVRVINDMPAPETIGDMHRFLGMINYVGKFILSFTTVSKPLLDLTNKKDVTWTIGLQYGQRFDK